MHNSTMLTMMAVSFFALRLMPRRFPFRLPQEPAVSSSLVVSPVDPSPDASASMRVGVARWAAPLLVTLLLLPATFLLSRAFAKR